MNEDFVLQYARLKVAEENCLARGVQVPPALRMRMHELEAIAKSRLTPQQLQAALHHVEVAKVRVRADAAREVAERRDKQVTQQVDGTVSSLTAGMLGRAGGLTRKELAAVAAGKALPKGQRMPQAQRDAIYRQQTRAFDPAGKGWGEAEWTKRLDALADATPEQFGALAKQYRADATALRATVDRWRTDRYEHGLRQRREASDRFRGTDPIADRPPNYEERRRATIVNAYLQHTADDIESDADGGRSDALDSFQERIDDSLRTETEPDGRLTRRAHIARAMEQHEQEIA